MIWVGKCTKITKFQGRRGSCLPVIVLLNTVCAEVDEASVAGHHQNHQKSRGRGLMCSCPSLLLNIKLC